MKVLVAAMAVLAVILTAHSHARTVEATPLAPFIDLQEAGLTVVQDGQGLAGVVPASANLTVNIGGPVRFALLYWAGNETNCTLAGPVCAFVQPFDDQQMLFNGTPITGTVIGSETQIVTTSGPTLHLSYFADVTSLVAAAGPGNKVFSFADGNPASNLTELQGVTLFVAYTNPADPAFYRVLVWDNGDFAFADDPVPGDSQVTAPVVFGHGGLAGGRSAELHVVGGGGTPTGPDQTVISNNPTQLNLFDATEGPKWDSDRLTVQIPANTGSTLVHVISTPPGAGADRLFWVMAAMRVPLQVEADVSLAKTAPAFVTAGENLPYTITVENGGPNVATNVSITDTLPPGTALVSFTQTGGAPFTLGCVASVCSATAASLPVGASATFSLVIHVPAATSAGAIIGNSAVLTATMDAAGAINEVVFATTTVRVAADVAVYKAISPIVPAPGSEVTYRVRVRNLGPSVAQNVVMTDDLPDGYLFVGFAANNPAGCNAPVNPNPVVQCARATLAPNTSVTWTFTARTPTGPDGRARNVATVTAATEDPRLSNNTAAEAATLQ